MKNKIIKSFQRLKSFCENESFVGWDPYDGLNSKVFQCLPFLKDIKFFRLVVIQGLKHCALNLRPFLKVPQEHNAKGLALFLTGYCNLYRVVAKRPDLSETLGSQEELKDKIVYLSELLVSMTSNGFSGACWGYNFDWQSKAFFLPKYTPTVVCSSFVVEALLESYAITGEEKYKSYAISCKEFIINDLNRIEKPNGFMFSYSPLDQRAVYNATLLGSKTLSLIYKHTNDTKLKKLAKESVVAVCHEQNLDGSFPHSDQVGNRWRDNFHTGFKLESLAIYEMCCGDRTFANHLEKGYEYWINKFFIKDKGIAKYYDTDSEDCLIDLHCVAQSMPTIFKLGKTNNETLFLIESCLNWAIDYMQSKHGFFYFQKKGAKINKQCYMRWPNAWMFYGISYYLRML